MIIKEIINKGIHLLSEVSSTPGLDIELLLSFVIKKDRVYILTNLEYELTFEEEEKINELLNQRINSRPIQYIIGKQEFMGLDFYVEEGVLIPRADTECLVEKLIELAKENGLKDILDIGVGSGAISVSLAKYLKESRVFGIDISQKALEIAKINAKNNNVEENLTIKESNLLSIFKDTNQKFDIIVSNPPYIKTEVINTLHSQVKDFEPVLALDGGEDGLMFYRKIVKDSINFLNPKAILAFEVGHDQAKEVKEIIKNSNEFSKVEIFKDLAGIERLVIGYKI